MLIFFHAYVIIFSRDISERIFILLDLYKNIRTLRQKLNMSQDDLAKKLGYTSRSSIAKIEKGEVDLSLSKIISFAKTLRTTPAELMGWEDESINTTQANQTKHPLLDIYDNLNSEGQKILLAHAEFLQSQPQYKKCDTISEKEIG